MRNLVLLIAVLLVPIFAVTASALADDQTVFFDAETASQEAIQAARGSFPSGSSSPAAPTDLTDPMAAEGVDLTQVDREESVDLLNGVFGPSVQAAAGIFDDLHAERFLAPNVAVIPAGAQPEVLGGSAAGGREGDAYNGAPTLLQSSIPLQAEDASGDPKAVDLSLDWNAGHLEPKNSLVDVEISRELGQGIHLSDVGVGISLPEAQDARAASLADQSVAFYPEIDTDTDFAVAPTPTGVETLTQLRSPDAPRTQTISLSLPDGASLIPTDDGGAEVRSAGETMVFIPPPTAIDATGHDVPVALAVEGHSLVLTTTLTESSQLPVLVDPLFQTYQWIEKNNQDGIYNPNPKWDGLGVHWKTALAEQWHPQISRAEGSGAIGAYTKLHGKPMYFPTLQNEPPGLYLWGVEGGKAKAGDFAAWNYTVPRHFSDQENYKKAPDSFITKMQLSQVFFQGFSDYYSPALVAGLWDDETQNWKSLLVHEGTEGHGLTDLNYVYTFNNSTPQGPAPGVKTASFGLQVLENLPNEQLAALYAGIASIELSEPAGQVPTLGTPLAGPAQWVNGNTPPIEFVASDTGLGVYSVSVTPEFPATAPTWKTLHGCVGVGGSACPRTWEWSATGPPPLKYEPLTLPNGINKLKVVAEDPLGNKSSAGVVQVKVDHSKPNLFLSGTLTEQAKLGNTGTQYSLSYSAGDGDSATAAALSPFGTPGTGEGKTQRPAGVAVDNAGNVLMTDRDCKCVQRYDESGKFLTQFGSPGTATGQFMDPRGITLNAGGDIWVADGSTGLVQKFNSKGEYLKKIGTLQGTGDWFEEPAGVATGPGGFVWILDSKAGKVFKFPEEGGQPQITTMNSLLGSSGITVDAAGHAWVTSKNSGTVLELDPSGNLLRSIGTEGTGNGQLKSPTGIAIPPSGNIVVVDGGNNRVQVFKIDGSYIRQFGTGGTANNQLSEAQGIAFGPGNVAYMGDSGNKRIARWSHADSDPQSGVASTEVKVDGKLVEPKYAPGCATQNCSISREWTLKADEYAPGPHTLEVTATDAVGLSTTKSLNFETHVTTPTLNLSGTMLEQDTLGTTRPRYNLKVSASAETGAPAAQTGPPVYKSSFGSSGTGTGQFNRPADVIRDATGNLWVVDQNNNRVQKFNANGEYVSKFGFAGSGNGAFKRPTAIAIDPKGNLWIADAENHRIQKFNDKGEFLAKYGSEGSGNGQFKYPEGIAVDASGNVYVSDTVNGRVQKFSEAGTFIKAIGTHGTGQGQLGEPGSIDIAPNGNLWIADWGNNRVSVFDSNGTFVRQFGSAGSGKGQFNRPDSIDVDDKGNVWVGDEGDRVQRFDETGIYIEEIGSPGSGAGQFNFSYAMGLTADSLGNLWIADTNNHRIQRWELKVPEPAPAYQASFGTLGSEAGQFKRPADVMRDAAGDLWVVDQGNNRVHKYNAAGQYLSKFGASGSADGAFQRPTAIAIDPKGNLWIADSENHRIQKFNSKGEFIAKYGSFGTGNGQFKYPEGIAVDAKGNVWVSDTENGRLQKFTEAGAFVKTIGAKGSGSGQLGLPAALDIAPNGDVFVADWENNRVSVFNESGTFVRQFGSSGSGNGQFNHADSIDVDDQGNVWVGDESDRIQRFEQSGSFIEKFGSSGSGAGQFNFSYATGLTADADGNLWIADTDNNRVQRWFRAKNTVSEVKTEISVDGQVVDTGKANCAGEHCPIVREWSLDATKYSSGNHTVSAKVTDGLGLSKTKTVPLSIQKDTTPPQLTASSNFFTAPEGWIQQATYPYSPSATDPSGYGVTSMVLKIDGNVAKTASQSCPDGGCSLNPVESLNTAPYQGGSHQAELIATDGAGNTSKKAWTVNVDPSGQITAAEAEDTLEAVDATADSNLVAPTSEIVTQQEREAGNDPSLEVTSGGQIESSGIPDVSVIEASASDGFAIGLPQSTVEAAPTSTPEGASPMLVVEDAAAVSANTDHMVDTVIRPIYDGVMAYEAIRDASGPETYSWELDLRDGQGLRDAGTGRDAEIFFEEDGSTALLISAEEAHDAVGTPVQTSLSISEGNVITLTVHHKVSNVVYPVVAGSAWKGEFTTEYVSRPMDETELEEYLAKIEHEKIERENLEHWAQWEQEVKEFEEGKGPAYEQAPFDNPVGYNYVGPPEILPSSNTDDEGATASNANPHRARWYSYVLCAFDELPGGCFTYKLTLEGRFEYNGKFVWWKESKPHPKCPVSGHLSSASLNFCNWVGKNHQQYGGGYHISSQGIWQVQPFGFPVAEEEPITEYMYGSGYANGHNTTCICNPLP